MRIFHLLCVAVLAVVLLPSLALACACCDAFESRELKGWSNDDRALVEFTAGAHCESLAAYEIYRGERRTCFDRFADSSKQTKCSELGDGYAAKDKGLMAPRTRPFPAFTHAPEALHPANYRVSLKPLQSEHQGLSMTMSLSLKTSAGFKRVMRMPIHIQAPDSVYIAAEVDESNKYAFDKSQVAALRGSHLRVRVWPSPNNKFAIVDVRGDNASETMGYPTYAHTFTMVRLPKKFERRISTSEALSKLGSIVLAPMTSERESDYQLLVSDLNRIGLKLIGVNAKRPQIFTRVAHPTSLAAGATVFAGATFFDPAYAAPRYNLAAVLAKQGLTHRSLRILKSLKKNGSDDAKRLLKKARADSDFEALKTNRLFLRLTK